MVSDPLDETALGRALAGRRFGSRVSVVESTGSTNADLWAAARAGAPDGAVVLAEHQTAGRGRAGRAWESRPRRGILLSALVRRGPSAAHAPLVPLAAGLAVADATEAYGSSLKWPNDVMVGQAKVGGVLVEAEVSGGQVEFAVVGIGVNVNHPAGELPPGATSLALAGGRAADRSRLVVGVLVALEERLAELAAPAVLLAAYRKRCTTLGRRVRVERRDGHVSGTALDIDECGALVVAGEHGLATLSSGDVLHLRTAEGGRA